jgi:hypothetical protein
MRFDIRSAIFRCAGYTARPVGLAPVCDTHFSTKTQNCVRGLTAKKSEVKLCIWQATFMNSVMPSRFQDVCIKNRQDSVLWLKWEQYFVKIEKIILAICPGLFNAMNPTFKKKY